MGTGGRSYVASNPKKKKASDSERRLWGKQALGPSWPHRLSSRREGVLHDAVQDRNDPNWWNRAAEE